MKDQHHHTHPEQLVQLTQKKQWLLQQQYIAATADAATQCSVVIVLFPKSAVCVLLSSFCGGRRRRTSQMIWIFVGTEFVRSYVDPPDNASVSGITNEATVKLPTNCITLFKEQRSGDQMREKEGNKAT